MKKLIVNGEVIYKCKKCKYIKDSDIFTDSDIKLLNTLKRKRKNNKLKSHNEQQIYA